MSKHTIHVNKHSYKVDADALTGAEIKALAKNDGVDADWELFIDNNGQTPDTAVPDGQSVPLKNGMKFRASPRGDRGCSE